MSLAKISLITVLILFCGLVGLSLLSATDALSFKERSDSATTTAQKLPPEKNSPPRFKGRDLDWTPKVESAPWEPRDSGESFLFQDKIWMIGGLNGNPVREEGFVEYWEAPHFNDIWHTKDGVTWDQAASSSAWPPRRSMSVVFFDGQLWMFGGWSPVTGYTNDIWTSEDGVNWRRTAKKADWPAREGQLAEVFQDKIWMIGGVNYDERQTKNDVWYSENGLDWTRVENIPWQPRWDHATAVFKGKLFLAGGMNLAGDTFNDIWSSEDGQEWTRVTDQGPWPARQGHALEVYKDKLWLIGRLDDEEGGGVNDVWFSEDGATWEKTATDPRWRGREDFFSEVFRDKIWLFGGMDADQRWRNDVWVSKFSTTTL